MPDRQRVTFAGPRKDYRQVCSPLRCRAVIEIESCQRCTKLRGCIFKVRSTRADSRTGRARRAGRDESFVTVQLESDPPERGADEPVARIVHLQGVSTTQVYRGSRRRIDNELTRRRPDESTYFSAVQSDPFHALAHGEQAHARVRLDLDLANVFCLQTGSRLGVGFKNLTYTESPRAFVRVDSGRSDPGCSCLS